MKEPMNIGGIVPQQDSYALSKPNATSAYLLECKLRRILERETSPAKYFYFHEQTGISFERIEEAIEDRVYHLSSEQLVEGISLYEEKGLIPLIHFLNKSGKYMVPDSDLTEADLEALFEADPDADLDAHSEDEEDDWGEGDEPDMETLTNLFPPNLPLYV